MSLGFRSHYVAGLTPYRDEITKAEESIEEMVKKNPKLLIKN